MDKTMSAFGGIRKSLGEERGSSFVSSMIGWFELLALTILSLNCKVFACSMNMQGFSLNIGDSCAFMNVLFLCKWGTRQ